MSALIFGAISGFVEVSICHPLDTIKTRVQNRNSNTFKTIKNIYNKEGIKGYYRGLTAVYLSVIPKNAIRFSSFHYYNSIINNNFYSGLLAGMTEAIVIVNPTEVCKIRIQSQYNSVRNPESIIKYKNIYQTIFLILKEEGISPFYRGIIPTVLRQSLNQATNFYFFNLLKNEYDLNPFISGCISGSIGPIFNNPLDVIKTKIQTSIHQIKMLDIINSIIKNDGIKGFYKGLFPRLLRIIPGQGITFTVYDYLQKNYK
jgi:solute carrier family 25 citrate transporter 1